MPEQASAEHKMTTRQVLLAARPDGPVAKEHFTVVDQTVDAPSRGEITVHNEFLAISAVQREQMEAKTELPFPHYEVGGPISGFGVGTVVAAGIDAPAQVGDLVMHNTPWATEVVTADAQVLDRSALPDPSYFLSNGPTALLGVRDIAAVGDGDVVLVSGAAGGVGSLAGQVAKRLGATRVIGTAGTQAKCDWLVRKLGFDAAIDYHDADLVTRLQEQAPDGIDVFIDLVGGVQFEAAVQVAAPHARFALGGALATQQSGVGWPRLDVQTAMMRNLTIRAFTLAEGRHAIAEWPALFAQWLNAGMVYPHTIVEGDIDDAPQTLIELTQGLFSGNVAISLP